jgi:hypothetical protein
MANSTQAADKPNSIGGDKSHGCEWVHHTKLQFNLDHSSQSMFLLKSMRLLTWDCLVIQLYKDPMKVWRLYAIALS